MSLSPIDPVDDGDEKYRKLDTGPDDSDPPDERIWGQSRFPRMFSMPLLLVL